jgi:recombination DNA repair RAD52 pathway protein
MAPSQDVHSDDALAEGQSDDRSVTIAMGVTSTITSKERDLIVEEGVVDVANRLLGFNGWSSEIRNINIDFVSPYHVLGMFLIL